VLLLLGGGFAFGCSLLLLFALYPSPTWRKGLTAVIIALLGLLPVFARISVPSVSRFYPLTFLHGQQLWPPPVTAWLLLCGLLVVGYLGFWSFRARGQRRVQIRYTLAGVGLVCLSVLLLFFLHVPRTQVPDITAPILACCCGIILLTYAHTARYPLLDGRLLLRPLLAFMVTLLVVAFFWRTFATPFYTYLLNTVIISFGSRAFIFNILQATSFLLLYPLIAFLVQRFLLRYPYDERKVQARTSAALLSVYSNDEIAERLVGILGETIRPAFSALYLLEGAEELRRRGPDEGSAPLPACLPASHPLWQALAKEQSVLLAEELRRYRDDQAAIGDAMVDIGAAVAVPLISAGCLRGCLLCAEKQSGDGYTRLDLQVLAALGQQTSLAVENAEHHERLSAFNAELEARVEERTRELAEANSQLQQANTAKDFFLALVSHELLNPLTGILGWADIGLRTEDPEMRTKVIDTIHKNGLRLKRLVYDLLDTARMIHGKLIVEPEPADLWYLTMISLKNVEQEVQTKGLEVVCRPPDGPLPIMADPGRMQQVIDNLLGNAIKFTPTGGTITLAGAREGDRCRLSLADTGKGIPADRLTRIFERFQQAPGDHKAGGLGLGLALVRGILDLHDGAAYAESAGPGLGSTFVVTMPALAEIPDPADPAETPVAASNVE
jgi:signal transduction histidine kinase